MPHELLIAQINRTNASNDAELSKLRAMILDGRESTKQWGFLGALRKEGTRPTELFKQLNNGENIFHLLAQKQLISLVLPTIVSAFNIPSFIKREALKDELGLSGNALTPTDTQITSFLHKHLTKANTENKTPWDLSVLADKSAIQLYSNQGNHLEYREISSHNDGTSVQFNILSQSYRTITKIQDNLGADYNDLELFIFLHARQEDHLRKKIQDHHNININNFFDQLFAAQTTENFIHKSSKGMSAFAVACRFNDEEMAAKLLALPNFPQEQQTSIKDAIFHNSPLVIQKITEHYGTATDWNQIMFSCLKHGRHEILRVQLKNLSLNDKISIPKGSKVIEYTALNYLLHNIKLICMTAASADNETKAQEYLDKKIDQLFSCLHLIAGKVDITQDQPKAISLLKQLRTFEGIYEKIAENDTINSLLDNVDWDEQGSAIATTVGNETMKTTNSMITIHDIKSNMSALLGESSGYDSADDNDGF